MFKNVLVFYLVIYVSITLSKKCMYIKNDDLKIICLLFLLIR